MIVGFVYGGRTRTICIINLSTKPAAFIPGVSSRFFTWIE
jgi:hypothetical protein